MSNKKIISDQQVTRLSKFISENMGLYFPEKRWNDLRDKFLLASMEYGFNDAEACINWLLSAPLTQEQIETLSSYLTVGETHFYRDKSIYDSLEKHVLPELINTRRKYGKYLRIWSAGCSSGEEPYSVAILLYKMLPDITDWNISISATDINQKVLEKAKEGIYKKWSFRSTPEWVKDGYFIKNQEDSFTIMPFIKNMVSFSYHNLAKDPFPSLVNNTTAIDIIFCRNVIMYFHPKLAHRIISQFYRSLPDRGWLIVSGSEGYLAHRSRFVTVVFPDTIFFRKDHSKSGEMETVETTGTTETKTLHAPCSMFSETDISQVYDVKCLSRTNSPEYSGGLPAPTETTETKYDPVIEASALYDQGNYSEAEDILTKYLLNDQKDPEAISLLAKIFSNQGKFSKAAELCYQGIETDKCNPLFYYMLGLIFQEQDKTEEAISFLRKSIYLDGDHILSYYALGNILFQHGDRKKAGKYFNNALSILDKGNKDIILEGSDGLSAGRLIEIIKMKNLPVNKSNRIK